METSPEQLWGQLTPVLTELGVNVLSAIVLIVVGWSLAGWAQRVVRRGLGRVRDMDRTLAGVLAAAVRYFILITVLIMVLGRFGVQTASIVAAIGAIGLAIGLALQGTLSNIASGMMLLFLRPFRLGDYVNANGHEGTVEEIGLFTTELTTYDGLYLSVPNGSIWGGRILNYSRNPHRRHDIVARISYGDDIDHAQAVLAEVLHADPRVLDEPDAPTGPQVLVRELGDSSVDLTMRFWARAEDYWPVSFDLRKAPKAALGRAGITIPFPQRVIHRSDVRADAA